jgi:hypothetical protein
MLHYLTFSRELWRSNTSYYRAWRPEACQFATCDLHSNQEARSAVARVMANTSVASSLELWLFSGQIST